MQHQTIPPQPQSDQYRLFILRVWQETPDGPQRYMLKPAAGGPRQVFANVKALADFLEQPHLAIKETFENV